MSVYILIPANYTNKRLLTRHIKILNRVMDPDTILEPRHHRLPVKIGRTESLTNQRLLNHISTALCQGSIPPIILRKFKVKDNTGGTVTEQLIINKCIELGGVAMPTYKSYPYEAKETYFMSTKKLSELIDYTESITDSRMSVDNIYKWAECKRELQRIKEEEGITRFSPY